MEAMFPGASALKHRDFRNLWFGQTISQLGDATYYMVFLFYARKVTGSDAVTGLVGAAGGLPFILFGPFAGVLADRIDRRKILVWCDILSAAILGIVSAYTYFVGPLSAPLIVATAFCLSAVNAFFMPAKSAAIPRLVPAEDLTDANSFSQATQNVMFMVGLAFSTFVLGAIERLAPNAFMPVTALVNGATFLGSLAFCLRIPSVIPDRDESKPQSVKGEFKEGFLVVWNDPVLRYAVISNFFNQMIISGFMVVYVKTNAEWFGGKYWTLGLVEFSFFTVVTVFSLVAGRFPIRNPGIAMAAGWGYCGLVVIPMAWAQNYGVFLGLNALCGVILPFSWLAISQHIQTAFADAVRGRVSSTWTTVSWGVQPLGVMIMGPIAAALGVSGTYIFMGTFIAIASFLPLLSRGFRETKLPEPKTT